MPRKQFSSEQIITKLREAEVLLSQGMRDELLDREIFYSLKEAQILIEMWRKHYNMVRPHSSLGYKPPAPATVVVQPSQIQQVSLTL